MAYIGDGASHDAVRAFAAETGFPDSTVQPGGIEVLTTIVGEATRLPKVILVDIDDSKDPVPALTRLIEALEGVSRIIAVGTANDVRLYRDLVTAGAVDYVVKPLNVGLLQTAFSAAHKLHQETLAAKPAQVIPLIGARGGVGTTTLAVNLGWLLAHQFDQTVALFDLDLQYGTSALALDLVPGRGLKEALETPGRLDSLLIASSTVSESDRFTILGAEEPIEQPLFVNEQAAQAITTDLKQNFQTVLVDLPRHLIGTQKRLLADATTILIVAEQTLAAIRDVVRLKAALKSMAPQAELLIVVSRVGQGKGERMAQVDQGTFEKGIQDTIAAIVPEDAVVVGAAANRGQALGKAAPQASVTLAICKLAEMLSGTARPETKGALWGRLAGKFRKHKAESKPDKAKE